MRIAELRRAIGALALTTLLALTACTAPSAAPRPGPTPAAESFHPGDVPDPSGAVRFPPAQRGDCPVDPAAPGLVTLVVTSDDDATPIEVTYPVFRADGTQQVRRMTQPGPVITVLQADCTDGVVDGPWRFVAEAETGALACALFFGGRLVASDSASAEGVAAEGAGAGVRTDCTGHPGM
ncbi:hypothetical protein [Agromyces aerolatus]|uniref:hypothetical protein n=1 Tax=Agromyces sp. LY-1074 TaxID=3074080 RepID=UPI0028618D10|nr:MULTISPECIES: hypothetical protein [unclassified Agromyces]MDR5700103.1 hypothetical protein [Agromyces sp. LY-1074]MDR5706529.1 hypothetical protein [Agromyces sp. LY-1358]